MATLGRLKRKFSPADRGRLSRLGLVTAQIEHLEAELFWVVHDLQPEPSLTAVRNELKKPLAAIQKARKAVSGLFALEGPIAREVMHRIDSLDHILAKDGQGKYLKTPTEVMEQILRDMGTLSAALTVALRNLPTAQVRHRKAHPYFIGQLDKALRDGYGAHIAGMESPPAYHPEPSASEGSAYREIMGICYRTAGHPTEDPERAIKAFIAQTKSVQPVKNVAKKARPTKGRKAAPKGKGRRSGTAGPKKI